jgi:hypothetical protein
MVTQKPEPAKSARKWWGVLLVGAITLALLVACVSAVLVYLYFFPPGLGHALGETWDVRVTTLEKARTVTVFLKGLESEYSIQGNFPLDERAEYWLLATTVTNRTGARQKFIQGEVILRDEGGRKYYQMGADFGSGTVEGGVLREVAIPVEAHATLQVVFVFVVTPGASVFRLDFPDTPAMALRAN